MIPPAAKPEQAQDRQLAALAIGVGPQARAERQGITRHPGGGDDPEQEPEIAIDGRHGLYLGGRGLDSLPGLREHRGEAGDLVDGPGIEPKRGEHPLLGQRRVAAPAQGGHRPTVAKRLGRHEDLERREHRGPRKRPFARDIDD
ncbi:MAG: hypothetical protein ACT4QB_16065 [Gammaproteobacteria bacterium]